MRKCLPLNVENDTMLTCCINEKLNSYVLQRADYTLSISINDTGHVCLLHRFWLKKIRKLCFHYHYQTYHIIILYDNENQNESVLSLF